MKRVVKACPLSVLSDFLLTSLLWSLFSRQLCFLVFRGIFREICSRDSRSVNVFSGAKLHTVSQNSLSAAEESADGSTAGNLADSFPKCLHFSDDDEYFRQTRCTLYTPDISEAFTIAPLSLVQCNFASARCALFTTCLNDITYRETRILIIHSAYVEEDLGKR